MSTIRCRTYVRKSSVLTLDNGDEVELDFAACDWQSPLVKQIGDKLAVGYLVTDEDCRHPLDDCDGMGIIIGRGKYQTNHDEREMFEALGLNRDGDKDYERDAVIQRLNKAWNEVVKGLSVETLKEVFAEAVGPLEEDGDEASLIRELESLRGALMDGLLVSEDVEDAIDTAVSRIGYTDSTYGELRNAATALGFQFDAEQDKAWEAAIEAGEIGDQDAVMLDVYDHSGLHWSRSGRGMSCRWDTTSGAGVWLPDAYARQEIDRRAPVYAHAFIRSTNPRLRTGGAYQLVQVSWDEAGPVHANLDGIAFSDSWSDLWEKAKAIAEGKVPTEKQLRWGRQQAADELAQQALDEYNAWISGDCYGCVTEVFQIERDDSGERTYTQLNQDSCWGYIGSDWAETALRDEFFDSVCADLEAELLAATTN